MLCHKCGNLLKEGARHCDSCGAAQERPERMDNVPDYYGAEDKTSPKPLERNPHASKKEFLSGYAGSDTRRKNKLVGIFAVITVVSLLVLALLPVFAPITSVPIVSLALAEEGNDPQELVEELRHTYEYGRQELAENPQDYTRQQRQAMQAMLDAMEPAVDNFSVFNMLRLLQVAGDRAEQMDYDQVELADLEGAFWVLVIMVGVVVVPVLLPLLFTVLAGAQKRTGFAVAALVLLVLNFGLYLTMSHPLVLIVCLAGEIVLISLCRKINAAYRSYQAGTYYER